MIEYDEIATPFEEKSLINAGTVLKLDQTNNLQVVKIPYTALYNFSLSTGFSISGIFQNNTSVQSTSAVVYKRSGNKGIVIQTSSFGAQLEFVLFGDLSQIKQLVVPIRANSLVRFWAYYDTVTSTIGLYVNGALRATLSTTGLVEFSSTEPFALGEWLAGSTTQKFNGLLSDIVFYNKIPTAGEVESLHVTNVVPKSLHLNVIGHHLANQNSFQTDAVTTILIKDQNLSAAWNAGCFSSTALNGDGYIECNADNLNFCIGFSETNTQSYGTTSAPIDFGVISSGGTLFYKNLGGNTNISNTHVLQDKIKFAREGTAFKIYKNDVLVYTSTGTIPAVTMYPDVSIYQARGILSGLNLNGTKITWTELNGVKAFNSYYSLDVANQYNYSKTTPIDPNNAQLIGFTDAQLGESGTHKIDFYNKTVHVSHGLYFPLNINKYAQLPTIAALDAIGTNYNDELTFFVEFTVPAADFTGFFYDKRGTTGIGWCFYIANNSVAAFIRSDQNTEFVATWNNIVIAGKVHRLVFKKVSNTRWDAFIDSRKLGTANSITSKLVAGNTFSTAHLANIGKWHIYNPFKGVISRVAVYNSGLTDDNCLKLTNGEQITGSVFYLRGSTSGDNFNDFSGNSNNATLYGYTTGEKALNGNAWVEKNSLLPARVNALRFINASQNHLKVANFNPTKEKGYTHIIGFALDSDRNFAANNVDNLISKRNEGTSKNKIIVANGATKQLYVNNHGQNFSATTIDLSPSKLNNIHIYAYTEDGMRQKFYHQGIFRLSYNQTIAIAGYDEVTSSDLTIGHDNAAGWNRYFNGYMFLCGIWKGVLSQADILNIVNNTLLNNPPVRLVAGNADCQLFLDFNKPVDVGGVWTIKDLSPQNRTIPMYEIGATIPTATDIAARFTPINNLR